MSVANHSSCFCVETRVSYRLFPVQSKADFTDCLVIQLNSEQYDKPSVSSAHPFRACATADADKGTG